MSVQTKKRFKNLGKIIGVVLFVALIFTNIKIALMDDAEIASGYISILDIELTLFEPTMAESWWCNRTCWWKPEWALCTVDGLDAYCLYMCSPFGANICRYDP